MKVRQIVEGGVRKMGSSHIEDDDIRIPSCDFPYVSVEIFLPSFVVAALLSASRQGGISQNTTIPRIGQAR